MLSPKWAYHGSPSFLKIWNLTKSFCRHEEANKTALEAIGGPKKRKFGDMDSLMGPPALPVRSRTKRVHLRDVMFMMESEKKLKHSDLLFRCYFSWAILHQVDHWSCYTANWSTVISSSFSWSFIIHNQSRYNICQFNNVTFYIKMWQSSI